MVILATPTAPLVRLRHRFSLDGFAYPEVMFQERDSRFSRMAPDLRAEACDLVAKAGGGVDGVQPPIDRVHGLFDYGDPEESFYDGTEEIPQLCDDRHRVLRGYQCIPDSDAAQGGVRGGLCGRLFYVGRKVCHDRNNAHSG